MLMIENMGGRIYLSESSSPNAAVDYRIGMADHIILNLYKESCRYSYYEDIDIFLKEHSIKCLEDEKELIFDNYFDLRQEALYGWRECLNQAVTKVLPFER